MMLGRGVVGLNCRAASLLPYSFINEDFQGYFLPTYKRRTVVYTKIILKPTNVGVWEITWHEYDAQVTGISNFLGIYHSTNPPNIEDMIEHILNAYGEDLTSM